MGGIETLIVAVAIVGALLILSYLVYPGEFEGRSQARVKRRDPEPEPPDGGAYALEDLAKTESYQRELDEYVNSKKTTFEIGRMYERYIGYLLERDGYRVKFSGANHGRKDMGRDLIAKKDGETLIIQAKYWAKSKIIRENLISQLSGSTEHYRRTHPKEKVRAVFCATTKFSSEAKAVAETLEIKLRHEKFDRNYPRIKCNIGPDGKKKYHLPCDDAFYDKVGIDFAKEEFYAKTTAEAVAKGFRRAFKYNGKRSA